MALLQSYTDFTILSAEYYEEAADLILIPQATGDEAMRELHYPGDAFPPIIYPDMPDRWENFDTVPLTNPPMTKAEQTLSGNKYARWPGYQGDRPVREIWAGSDTRSRVWLVFFRSLIEYWFNPPDPPDYITWWPKDRSSTGYNVLIEDISIGGTSVLSFEYLPVYYGLMTKELTLTMRVMGEYTG
jgi:hypothetical protein